MPAWMQSWRSPATLARSRRLLTLGLLLLTLSVAVPDAGRAPATFALIKLDRVHGVDAGDDVIWFLALGSDARPGQSVLRSRADAIQLVGVDAATHRAVIIGIPRDSYVDIPGYGSDKINAAMVFGGPELTSRAVAELTGIQPDYVFVTSFPGLIQMVTGIHGVRAKVTHSMNDLNQSFRPGMHTFTGVEALAFARTRYGLPRGDFDRSMNQGQLLKGGVATIAEKLGRPGFMERALEVFGRHTDTNVGPVELYRLARAVAEVNPALVRVCVAAGSIGYAGSASVVFPDVSALRSLAQDVRNDAKVDRGC
jgi:LCP family protein required for cell wall assembly